MKTYDFTIKVDGTKIEATRPYGGTVIDFLKGDDYLFFKELAQQLLKLIRETNKRERLYFEMLGKCLYKILFTEKIDQHFGEFYQSSSEDDEMEYRRVILNFASENNNLGEMPWEYLYYPARNIFLSASPTGKIILVRFF